MKVPKFELLENDILLAKDGAGIGKIGIVKKLISPATVNSSLLVIRSLEAFLPKYLFYILSGTSTSEYSQGADYRKCDAASISKGY